MKRLIRKIFFSTIVVLITGCTSLPKNLYHPDTRNSAILGVSIKTRSPIRIFVNKPQTIYFVKLDKGVDMYRAVKIIPSNFCKGGYAYIVNAEPGQYIAVASSLTKSEMTYNTFYDKNAIKNTLVEVKPGEVTFGGKIIIDDHLKNLLMNIEKNGDSAQRHYFDLMKSFMDGTFYCGTLLSVDRSEKSAREFYLTALKDFKKSDWLPIIQRRLDLLDGNLKEKSAREMRDSDAGVKGNARLKGDKPHSDKNKRKKSKDNKREDAEEAPIQIP